MGRSRRGRPPAETVRATIESIDLQSGGVAHVEGRPVYIRDTLPGEEVLFTFTRAGRGGLQGRVKQILKPSPERTDPHCPSFGVCGGCSLQHWQRDAQLRAKQALLLDTLQHTGDVQPETLLQPLAGRSSWGYRTKARLGVKYVPKKGRVLVGFRERGSGFICETQRCLVLDPRVGDLLGGLAEMIGGLSIRDRLPQIEIAAGEEDCVLVFRVLAPPLAEDLEAISDFCLRHGVTPYLQTAGPESVQPLAGKAAALRYRLPAHGIGVDFLPADFTQVNMELNRLMVDQALQLLALHTGDRVLDLFCGLGNFTLPISRQVRQVVGVDADPGLIGRAFANAQVNGIDNVRYYSADLYQGSELADWSRERYDKVLLDPPRSGAKEVLDLLSGSGAEKILYVSCYPETLARDAGILVREHGYRLVSAGVMDMFPHTAHIESMALFQSLE